MKESLVPILFGGKINIEKKRENQEEEKKNDGGEHPPLSTNDNVAAEKEFKLDHGFKYNDVVCGSS